MKTKLFYLLLFICSYCYAQIPTTGLSANYEFTNGALTDAVNSETFTQTGMALTTINDRLNNANGAINLNGDYLSRTNISTGSEITYSFWVKTNTDTFEYKTIIDDSEKNGGTNNFASTQKGYSIMLYRGKIIADVRMQHRARFNSAQVHSTTTATSGFIADGNWHHVVVRFQSYKRSGTTNFYGLASIHIDGSLHEEIDQFYADAGTLPFFDTNGNVALANNRNNTINSNLKYNDAIDDILIYNRKLTDQEILNIRNVGGFCVVPNNSLFSSTATTGTSIALATPTTAHDIAYHKSSEPFANATIVTQVLNSTTINGLNPSTPYKFYIRTPCAATGTSAWSAAKTIRTTGTIYVNHAATGNNDGSSWANAYTDLRSSIFLGNIDSPIWVAGGTYKPHASIRTVSFHVNKENIKIYGGFAGNETTISQRIVGANETILSGDLQGNDANLTDFASNYANSTRNADNSYHIINIASTANNLLLDGLTISDAHTNVDPTEKGGAIIKDKTVAKLTLKNCIIKDNVSRNDNAGLLAEFDLNNTSGTRGTLVIENCQFINNMSRYASGIYSFIRDDTNVDITIANSLFDNNLSGDLNSNDKGISGSASWFRMLGNGADATLNLTNNTYVNNTDTGTTNNINNLTRAVVGISIPTGFNGVFNAQVNNCIFWGNKGPGGSTTRSITDLYSTPINSLVINNSIDELNFNDDSITGKTNTSNSDPLFTSTSDFTLQSTSPAINFGNNSYLPSTITTDLLGNDRISIGTIDAGAYEYQCNNCLGISINKVGNGTVTQSSGPVYNNGDSVTLTATNVAGWEFVEWSGDITGTTNPITFTINSNLNITATFSKVPTYVNKNATGNNDGTSWTDAFTDLQNVLLNTVDDAEIWVAAGTYTSSTTNNRSTSFNIVNKGVKVYGGFIGTETQLDQRDFINNKTILSGDINGDDTGVSFTGNNRGENMHHVVRINANDVILDGLIINDGQADTTINGEIDYAGAVYVGDVVNGFTIKNSEFNNNVGVKGGAIRAYFANNAAVVIENSIFNNNLSQYGSGAYILANNNSIVTVSITNSLFTNNTSADVNSSAKGFTGSSLWIRANGVNSSMTTNINNVTFAKNNDIGTQSNTGRGTLGLSRRTDDNSTHNVTVNNTIFYHNVGVNGVTATSINQGHTSIASITNINNTIDEDNFSIYNSTSNFNNISSTDPQFKDVANNDFTLNTGSPAIDAGDNTKVASNNTKDLLGNVRIFNSTVDMGPYESTAIIQRTLTINEINGTISVNPNPNSFSGNSGTYDDGTSVELTATPDSGYQFDGWSGDATGATNPLTITMDTDKTVTAIFSLIQRTLTINATNGGVTTNPNPTNGTYANGASVELTATPDSGYQFDGWSGDATGITNPLTITMDANKTVTAIFSRIQRTLTINEINGTISVNPNPNSFNGNSGTYDDGTSVELTATPDSGYQFDGWSGDATGTTNPLTITMNSDKTVTANFSLIERTLTINAVNGNVTTNPNPTNGKYVNGTSVELTATPNVGYQFDGWSGDVTGTTNPLTITMDSDKTITANFSQIQHTLTINIIGTGTLDVASGSIYNHGELVTLTATPGTNFTVREWTGDVIAGAVTSVQVTMDADKTVSVEFESTLNIKDVDKIQGLKMFPNPTKGDLILDFQEQVKAIELYNLQGKIIKKFITKIIDISSVSNGVYVLKITTKNGKIAVKRVIKN